MTLSRSPDRWCISFAPDPFTSAAESLREGWNTELLARMARRWLIMSDSNSTAITHIIQLQTCGGTHVRPHVLLYHDYIHLADSNSNTDGSLC